MIIRILILGFIFQLTTALMTLSELKDEKIFFLEKCFENGLPKQGDTGFTIDNFIYLVEKYERKHPEQNILTNTLVFLKEFNCDGIIYPSHSNPKPADYDQEKYASERFKILRKFLFKKFETMPSLKDDDFTEEEKCHLFFTLTHTVYKTDPLPKIHREGITTTTTTETPNDETLQEQTKVTVEQGVSSLDGKESTAISLGEVLYGILGALMKDVKNIKEFVESPNNNDKKFFSSFVFSLSALIAIKEMKSEKYYPKKENKWNSAECTKQYVIQENAKILTKANFLGSLDGYLMGRKILETEGISFKLSQLLRMYYGQQTYSNKNIGETFCKRGSIFEENNFKMNLTEQIKTYISYELINDNKYSKDTVETKSNNAINSYFNFGHEITSVNVQEELCKSLNKSKETPSNIVIVLDKREHFDEQIITMAKLIGKLNIEPGESNVKVLVNSEANNDMKIIVDTTDNKAKASCDLAEYHENNQPELDEGSVLEAINRTLMNIEQSSISLPGVPSKVVVYYNYGSSENENKQVKIKIENARRELINKHRAARIIAIGEDEEHLKKLIKDPSINTIDPRTKNVVKELEDKIPSTPAEFQYQECKTRSKFGNEHLLHISSDGVEYWQMQPKYFYKSFGYKLRFKPENGNIRVCFDRKPDIKELDCQQTNEQKIEIEFSKRDPCKGSTAVTCDPFYFKISGIDDASLRNCETENDESADKPVCKRLNEIKVKFDHEGLACSNAIRQIGSFYQILMIVFATIYIVSRKS